MFDLYGKHYGSLLGDKSPDIYRSPELVQHLVTTYPLIYTVRDPRAILNSIEIQTESTPEEKAERWELLIKNYQVWRAHLDRPNVIVVRFEDLVAQAEATMRTVYSHLGLSYSSRYMGAFKRPHPERFLWPTAVDWNTGDRKDFDPSRISSWKTILSDARLANVASNSTIREFMVRFRYDV